MKKLTAKSDTQLALTNGKVRRKRWIGSKTSKILKHAFLKFDIVSFYPSITPKLLENAIKFGRSVPGIFISKADEEMILHCRKSFLFCEEEPWEKIGPVNFDVPMGSYDGAEVCELVGLYILTN